jgi:V-type H+-transporting ATPase subunit d
MRFLEEAMEGLVENRTTNDVLNLFKEMKAEFIRTSLKKMWLEDFYEYCSTELNSTSTEMLMDLLKFEADFKTIQVAYNTMNNKDLNTTAKIITTRK